jgi:hypothetical protein
MATKRAKKQHPILYRQGDVLIRCIDALPGELTEVPREAGRVVLAHGEVTGHSHAIAAPEAKLWSKGTQRFLETCREVVLHHEEHKEIDLPKGIYEIVIQREYTPEAIRNVAD